MAAINDKLEHFIFASVFVLDVLTFKVEKDFFKQPLATRVERLRKYSLEDQYKIFRYGNDKIEPPLMDLAIPIAERGRKAVPFLMDRLNAKADDETVIDVVLIFDRMALSKSYDVKDDATVMSALSAKVAGVKDPESRNGCLVDLQRIRNSN